ncbi:hypothetical protein Hanom_Chr05g00474031 [Helianthus anomalus]
MKDVNLIEPAHEPSQTKLELDSFTNRPEPSRASSFTTDPISSRAFFELF